MEDNLNYLLEAVKEFRLITVEGVNLYNELIRLANEQHMADIESFLSKVPNMTQDEISRDATYLSGKKRGIDDILNLLEVE